MYPVLRPGSDDFPQGNLSTRLQVGTEFSQFLPMSLSFELIEPSLSKLIRENLARCACLIECRATLYREVVMAALGEYVIREKIETNQIMSRVEIHPIIIANDSLELYTGTAHEEYGGEIFSIKFGQPLAFDHIWTFSLRPKSSPMRGIFDLVATDDLETGQFAVVVDFKRPVIDILVERETKKRFDQIDIDGINTIPSVYFGVLMEVLFVMRQADRAEKEGCKWASSIQSSLDELGITLCEEGESIFSVAQKLLETPFNLLLPEQVGEEGENGDEND